MDRKVSLKVVIAAVAAVVALGGAFVGGMAYENHRIKTELERAFGSWGEDEGSEDSASEEVEEVGSPDPIPVREGEPFVATPAMEGAPAELTITLSNFGFEASSGTYDDPQLTREFRFDVRVENSGSVPVDSWDGNGTFVGDDGQVYDFAGIMCDNSVPYTTLEPGQFVEGCALSAVPAQSGQFQLNGFDEPYFIRLPAA